MRWKLGFGYMVKAFFYAKKPPIRFLKVFRL